ncbi:hypothetical protein [Pseudobutyrivibrio sp.]|uniref:hypothetical protein n=1 Tax=Pseudobutyrivibrio sp. TaxID=2014367 RepID=UPI00386E4F7A
MAITEAQKRATYKYREKFEEVRFRVTKEQKEQLKAYCEKNNVSISEFVSKIVLDALNS